MDFPFTNFLRVAVAAAAVCFCTSVSVAQTVLDFESSDSLSSPYLSGDLSHFEVSAGQAHGGAGSLSFADKIVAPYESWTYDIPVDLTSGTISLWFYDKRGAAAYVPHHLVASARWGGAIIIEDSNDPADFGAVEIAELPYGPKYYASEGAVNRGALNSDSFGSDSLPLRAEGFHKVELHITPADTKIFIDGLMADEVAGPGSTGNNLRLRFMYDSPSNGGLSGSTWFDAPAATSRGKVSADGSVPDWIYYDDITITAELPAVATHHLDFEVINETADYDTKAINQGSTLPVIPPNDNLNMEDFVNQWQAVTTATAAHSGTAAARFANVAEPFQSIEVDVTPIEAGTTVSLWFYDSQGPTGSYANVRGNAILVEEGDAPANFHAIEISTFPFPHGGTPKYYLTVGTAADSGQTLYSGALGPRSIGWHKVDIGFYQSHTEFAVDGVMARYNSGAVTDGPLATGPGLDKNPKLRLLGDTAGIGRNYADTDLIYENSYATRDNFVFFDDITLPFSSSSVSDWSAY